MDKRKSQALAAAILALGEYNRQQLSESRRTIAKDRLLQIFCEHKDVAVHSACRWLLNRWGFQKDIQTCVSEIETQQPRPGYRWHEDPIGVCFALFDPVESYTFGLGETAAVTGIPRRFGIATHEFTRQQFADLENQLIHLHEKRAQKNPGNTESAGIVDRIRQNRDNRTESERTDVAAEDAPVTYVTWDYVAFHCNGLSQRSGLPSDQDVYFGPEKKWDLVEANNGLDRLGYRMPTSREWEFACRAGVSTRFFFGDTADLFPAYGWSVNNSRNIRQSTGRLKPNDNGIFDIQGNASELCHNLIDPEGSNRGRREVRDQSCAEETSDINLFSRSDTLPRRSHERRGFRLARTYEPDSE